VYAHAVEASEGLAHAWPAMLPEDLPGPLFDGVVTVWGERRRAEEHRQAEATYRAKHPPTPGMEQF
jgi:hypothetical protein